MQIRAEFTVYPFREGQDPPPDYVQAAIGALTAAGMDVEVGLLGQIVTGEAAEVLEALRAAEQAALDAGATRVAVNVELA